MLYSCGSSRRITFAPFLVSTASECRNVIAHRWHRLSLGMALYTGALLALLWACLGLTGAGVAPAVVLVGFTAERVLTLIPFTPGGVGVVEVGLTSTLLLLGGTPAGVVAGVLLYRLLTFAFEIPVGGVVLAAWCWACRGSLRQNPVFSAGGGRS
ncbi:MAG: lysylphosphatidylglycerol synthase domain-containing protein [Ornithinibacter sp.]